MKTEKNSLKNPYFEHLASLSYSISNIYSLLAHRHKLKAKYAYKLQTLYTKRMLIHNPYTNYKFFGTTGYNVFIKKSIENKKIIKPLLDQLNSKFPNANNRILRSLMMSALSKVWMEELDAKTKEEFNALGRIERKNTIKLRQDCDSDSDIEYDEFESDKEEEEGDVDNALNDGVSDVSNYSALSEN